MNLGLRLMAAKTAAAGGFDPTTLVAGVRLWLDPTDAAVFTYSSGVLVSQWDDKSGNALHFTQATSTKQFSRSGTQNGLDTVVCDGTDDWMKYATAAQWCHATDGTWTSWGVYVPTSVTGTRCVFTVDDQENSKRIAQNIRANGAPTEAIAFNTAVSAFTDTAASLSIGTCYILTAIRRATDVEIYVNGATTGATATTGTPIASTAVATLGARNAAGANANSFAAGEIGDIIHVNDDQSAADMNILGEALADRWDVSWTTIA